MEVKEMSQKAKQKRKFLLMLPILVIPFLTAGLLVTGVIKDSQAHATSKEQGFNFKLPNAKIDDKPMDKLAYYERAKLDSLKRNELYAHDPYYQKSPSMTITSNGIPGSAFSSNLSPYPTSGNIHYQDPNEARVYEKLGALNRVLDQSVQPEGKIDNHYPNAQRPGSGINPLDVDRLEQMMKMMQSSESGDDPETQQLNSMLERILDIQHPERVQQKIKEHSDKKRGLVFPVQSAPKKDRISVLSKANLKDSLFEAEGNGFYGLNEDGVSLVEDQNAIEAVIHENQTLVNGSTVKLRLLGDINVNGVVIPKDQFVFGSVQLSGERLMVSIKGIRYEKSLYPVKLSVFDIDGMDGIYVPGAITRDVAKQSADRSIQSIGMSAFDQSLGVQAAGAGIEAAKTLLSKKIKLIKVMVKAGYRVLLRDDNQKDGL